MREYDQLCTIPRTSSSDCSNNLIAIASEYQSTSIIHRDSNYSHNSPNVHQNNRDTVKVKVNFNFQFLKFLLLKIISLRTILPTCPTWLKYFPTTYLTHYNACRKVTGTLFGHRKGHVSFAVQNNSTSSEPSLLIEFAMSTTTLVRDMSSPLVRIALQCEKGPRGNKQVKLFREPRWAMYCNGRKCGHALLRACTDSDRHVLHTVRNVSVGAGVIPVVGDGRTGSELDDELVYMRANFERVVGNRDSEAFYMMNLDGNGGHELSIFLIRT